VRKTRIFWKLFLSFLLIAVVLLAIQTIFTATQTASLFMESARQSITAKSQIILPEVVSSYFASSKDIGKTIGKLASANSVRITLTATNGDIIADSVSNDLPNISNSLQKYMLLQAKPVTAEFALFDDQTSLVCSSPVMDGVELVAALIVSMPSPKTTEVDSRLSGLLLISLLASIIIAGLATVLVSRGVTIPLLGLRRGLNEFGKGNFDYRIKPLSTVEFSEIANGMNETSQKVRVAMNNLDAQRNMLDGVLESMTEGVMAVGLDERLIGMNHFACQLLGIDLKTMRGRLMQEVTRDVGLLGFIKKALESGNLEESEITLAGQGERVVKLTGSPLKGSDDSFEGVIVVLADITKLRHLENIRKEFVSNVSHELRTPITSIKGFVETLLGGAKDSPEDQERFLGIIAKHASRLNGIVEDLMELSKIEEAQSTGRIEFDEADPKKAVELSIAYMRDKASLKGIKIDANVKSAKCSMNLNLIEHAVSNLIDNAINYSDSGKTIWVTGNTAGDSYQIQVRDEGIGIEKHHLPRLFERFYRVDKGRDRSNGGTGLGLAIVKHIVQAHNGKVSVSSDLGVGSTFTITLPVLGSSQSANK